MSFARVRALAIVGVLVTCAAILVAVTLFKDHQRGTLATDACPKGAVIADVRLPEPKNIKIMFFDSTGNPALASSTSEEFKNRQFQVTVKDVEKTNNKVATLRYGPKSVGAAWLLRAYFLDSADTEFDIARTDDDTVDVVLGGGFRKLATTSEVGQALAQLGRAENPSGTCAERHDA